MFLFLALAVSPALVALAYYCGLLYAHQSAKNRRTLAKIPAESGPLFFDQSAAKLAERIEMDAQLRKVFHLVEKEAHAMLLVPLPEARPSVLPEAEDAPQILKIILYLSFTYLIKKDKACLEKATEQMRFVATFRTWNPSDHLATSVISAALAIGYNWLYPDLSVQDRTLIGRAIIKKGLRSIYLPIVGNWWTLDSYNHAQVGFGGLGLSAAVLLKDFPKQSAKILSISIGKMTRALVANYGSNGEYREGPAYWAYGTTYSVLFISALEKITGNAFGMDQIRNFMDSPKYIFHSHGPSKMVANFFDSAAELGPVEILLWFAKKNHDPTLAWLASQKMEHHLSRSHCPGNEMDLFLPFYCIWKPSVIGIQPPQKSFRWACNEKSVTSFLRTGWAENDSFVALKGGGPNTRHGQMDAGSFIFESDGVRWGIDLGTVNYRLMSMHGIYLWRYHRNASRWKVFRLNNFCHNTITINNHLQGIRGKARIVHHSTQEGNQYTVMDLSGLYAKDAKKAYRGVSLLEGNEGLLVQDEITAKEKPISIRWAMATEAVVELMDDQLVRLRQHGKELWLKIIGGKQCQWQVFCANPQPAIHDEPNPNVQMVGFTISIERHGTVRYSVLLSRLIQLQNPGQQVPLADWGSF